MHISFFLVLELNTNVFVLLFINIHSQFITESRKFFNTVLKTLLLLDNNTKSLVFNKKLICLSVEMTGSQEESK